ncbi:hypothetical protein HaLaN_24490 [Haematococcus lacustris]|uniref:Uncharacterized protein n=1 Tax=Haematococcus lacustris TaxID=44745 RepID=A0A699ZUI3_HAELA|nr:hypothetical protein HaLaN_24490 [Haematococcus lacustris]
MESCSCSICCSGVTMTARPDKGSKHSAAHASFGSEDRPVVIAEGELDHSTTLSHICRCAVTQRRDS